MADNIPNTQVSTPASVAPAPSPQAAQPPQPAPPTSSVAEAEATLLSDLKSISISSLQAKGYAPNHGDVNELAQAVLAIIKACGGSALAYIRSKGKK